MTLNGAAEAGADCDRRRISCAGLLHGLVREVEEQLGEHSDGYADEESFVFAGRQLVGDRRETNPKLRG